MNNILITGAAGFLGSKYAEFFSKMHNVYALDINLTKLLYLKKKIKSINIFKIDITNEEQIKKFFLKLKKKKSFY
jgi:nucleoside-diphosphate-sugar epimerase